MITYAQLHEVVSRSACHLARQQIGQGDRIGLLLQDHADHLILILSAACLGAATVSLNWRSKLEEKRLIAEAFGLKLLVNDPTSARPRAFRRSDLTRPGETTSIARRATAADRFRAAPRLPNFLLTSGTSGAPKGVELTHAGLMTWCDSVRLALGLRSRQRHLSVLPLGFTGSVVFNLPHLLLGDTVDLFPSFFTPEEFVAAVKARAITSSSSCRPSCDGDLRSPTATSRCFPGSNIWGCLGAPLTPDERRAAKRRLTPGFFENYGASAPARSPF